MLARMLQVHIKMYTYIPLHSQFSTFFNHCFDTYTLQILASNHSDFISTKLYAIYLFQFLCVLFIYFRINVFFFLLMVVLVVRCRRYINVGNIVNIQPSFTDISNTIYKKDREFCWWYAGCGNGNITTQTTCRAVAF